MRAKYTVQIQTCFAFVHRFTDAMQTVKILVMGVVAVSAQTGKNACGNKSPFGFVDQSNTVVVDSSFPPVAAVSMGMDMMEGLTQFLSLSIAKATHSQLVHMLQELTLFATPRSSTFSTICPASRPNPWPSAPSLIIRRGRAAWGPARSASCPATPTAAGTARSSTRPGAAFCSPPIPWSSTAP